MQLKAKLCLKVQCIYIYKNQDSLCLEKPQFIFLINN